METSVDLRDTLQAARRRAWIVAVSLAAALAAAYGITRLIPPEYEATATLFVGGNVPSEEPALDVQYASLAQSLVLSYAKLADTHAVATDAARRARLAPREVIGHIDTEAEPGLQILRLRARASSRGRAARIANAAALALAGSVRELNGPSARRIGIQLIDPASAPVRAASPHLLLNLVFGGLVGLLIGVGLAVARERLDKRIRTAAEVERELGLPVLAVVPKLRRRILRDEALARHANQDVAESYRNLAVTLATLARRGEHRRILITSARPEEGKTTAAAHVALALAEDNRRIALIEGDLRRPALRGHFPSDSAATLDDVLHKTVDWRLPKSTGVCPGLRVLVSGQSEADVGLILRLPQFQWMLDAAARDHELVLLDAPPALAVSDTSVLARHADTVLLVVRSGATRAEDIRAAQAALRRLGVDIAGVALVGARRSRRGRYYYYGGGANGLASLQQLRPITEAEPRSEVSVS